ncbi:homeobox domain protein [Dictyocaulus viviparus]|uniref:Homeobox domain protein n=1 Tax=Dictyocaulus viviparus TaxID=29172 RepID=A0A0D8XQ71_DICVI|nr:homeobox domain protein [Dictyocaulus viviparus]
MTARRRRHNGSLLLPFVGHRRKASGGCYKRLLGVDFRHNQSRYIMISTYSPPPSTASGDPLSINFGIMNQISVSPRSTHGNENIDNDHMLHSQSPGLELTIGEITVASAVASEKARMRQQSAMLDKWLMANGGNLYPCREDKEKLASLMKMTYLQVNRWFANRRRKQTKRTKTVPSPVSATPANFGQERTSRPNTPVSKENIMTQLTPDVISAFAQANMQSKTGRFSDLPNIWLCVVFIEQ